MNRFLAPLIVLLIAALLYLAWVALTPAMAHSWYSSQRDPLSSYGCCGGNDCAPVDPAWVSEVPGGFRLVMTLEQARTVNPMTDQPVDAVIPLERVQSPPHGHAGESQYHACIYNSNRMAPQKGVICFFATPTM